MPANAVLDQKLVCKEFTLFSCFCRKWSQETISHILKLANSDEASKAGTFVVSGHSIFKEKQEVKSIKDNLCRFGLSFKLWTHHKDKTNGEFRISQTLFGNFFPENLMKKRKNGQRGWGV